MYTYPFSAIVGQEQLNLALILNAIQPAIGGVLIRGNKGTAKSTADRALTAVPPPLDLFAGRPYRSAPGPERLESRLGSANNRPLTELLQPVPISEMPGAAAE